MESIFTSEGRAIYNPTATPKYRYEYQYKDNTGDVTLVFSDLNNDGAVNTSEVIQQTTYYPFGLDFYGTNYNQIGVVNKFKFNGKELQDDFGLNLYDYGARHYDPVIGRWGVVDPMANERISLSLYNYCQNNPINKIDPDGALDLETEHLGVEQRPRGGYGSIEETPGAQKAEIQYQQNQEESKNTDDSDENCVTCPKDSPKPEPNPAGKDNLSGFGQTPHFLPTDNKKKDKGSIIPAMAGAGLTFGEKAYFNAKAGTWTGKNFKTYSTWVEME